MLLLCQQIFCKIILKKINPREHLQYVNIRKKLQYVNTREMVNQLNDVFKPNIFEMLSRHFSLVIKNIYS